MLVCCARGFGLELVLQTVYVFFLKIAGVNSFRHRLHNYYSSLHAGSYVKFVPWHMSWWPPVTDQLLLRGPKMNSSIWLCAVDGSTININMCIIITKRSRDALWFCAIGIHDWCCHWHLCYRCPSCPALTVNIRFVVSSFAVPTSFKCYRCSCSCFECYRSGAF